MNGIDNQDRKVFIGGLSWETTNEKLKQYFENFGLVEEAFVNFDKRTGRPRGFGFVVFRDSQIADKVVTLKHTIDRREVEAKKAVPKQDQANGFLTQDTYQANSKVFVGGLPPTVDDTTFRKYFEDFGPVKDAVVMYEHDTKRPRGFGFVTFVNQESINALFESGKVHRICDKSIEVKLAVPKDQMPAQKRPLGAALPTTTAFYNPDLSLYHPYMGLQQPTPANPYTVTAGTYTNLARVTPTPAQNGLSQINIPGVQSPQINQAIPGLPNNYLYYPGQPLANGGNVAQFSATNVGVSPMLSNMGAAGARPPMSANLAQVPGAVSYPSIFSQVSQAVGLAPTQQLNGNASGGMFGGIGLGSVGFQNGLTQPDPLGEMAALAVALPDLQASQGISGQGASIPGSLM